MVKWVKKSSYRRYGAPEITEFANTLDFDEGITPESIQEAAVRLLERMRKEMKERWVSIYSIPQLAYHAEMAGRTAQALNYS